MATDTVDTHPREIIDLLAAATAELLQGKTITQIETMWKRARGVGDNRHYLKEILLFSDNHVHLFMRSATAPDIVAAVVSRSDVSVGMLLSQARRVLREAEAAG